MASDPGYRRTWRLRGLMDEYLVVRGAEVHAGEEQDRIAAEAVLWRLRGWRGDSGVERTLLEIYEALGGRRRAGFSILERRSFLEQVWTEVEEAFQTERLALLKLPRPVFIPSEREEIEELDWTRPPPEPPPAKKEQTFISICLLGEDEQPVPSVRYRVTLPDGSAREGTLDDQGSARIDGIPPGLCKVTFPELDEGAWGR